jgi:amidophosphoribosyltransferase
MKSLYLKTCYSETVTGNTIKLTAFFTSAIIYYCVLIIPPIFLEEVCILHEACGVFGIYAPGEDISRLTYFALFALQHRGQESAGIATTDGSRIDVFARMGLVSQVFDEEALGKLSGKIAIGHNRYSTRGSSNINNVQPIIVGTAPNNLAIAHNGNITNAEPIYQELINKGYTFKTATDTEVAANLILSSPEKDMVDKIRYAMRRLQGAYSMVVMDRDTLYGIRDPLGVRPLCLGTIGNGNGNKYVIASETCALNHIGANVIREIEPGEIVAINERGIKSYSEKSEKKALCIFEYIYFSRPDSIIKNRLLYKTRQAMGAGLAEEHPVDADMVIGVPDSATAAGFGYAVRSGIPIAEGLIKNRYMGRTFIAPDQRIRELGVKVKFNPLKEILEGKRIVLVDDSIVRGTTTPQVIKLLRRSGAKEVHMRICAPPICYPCFLGVDMANRWELIAAQKTIPEIRDFIGADSLGYLSLEGLIKAVDLPKEEFCLACFTGDYPMPVQLSMDKLAFESTCPKKHALLKK